MTQQDDLSAQRKVVSADGNSSPPQDLSSVYLNEQPAVCRKEVAPVGAVIAATDITYLRNQFASCCQATAAGLAEESFRFARLQGITACEHFHRLADAGSAGVEPTEWLQMVEVLGNLARSYGALDQSTHVLQTALYLAIIAPRTSSVYASKKRNSPDVFQRIMRQLSGVAEVADQVECVSASDDAQLLRANALRQLCEAGLAAASHSAGRSLSVSSLIDEPVLEGIDQVLLPLYQLAWIASSVFHTDPLDDRKLVENWWVVAQRNLHSEDTNTLELVMDAGVSLVQYYYAHNFSSLGAETLVSLSSVLSKLPASLQVRLLVTMVDCLSGGSKEDVSLLMACYRANEVVQFNRSSWCMMLVAAAGHYSSVGEDALAFSHFEEANRVIDEEQGVVSVEARCRFHFDRLISLVDSVPTEKIYALLSDEAQSHLEKIIDIAKSREIRLEYQDYHYVYALCLMAQTAHARHDWRLLIQVSTDLRNYILAGGCPDPIEAHAVLHLVAGQLEDVTAFGEEDLENDATLALFRCYAGALSVDYIRSRVVDSARVLGGALSAAYCGRELAKVFRREGAPRAQAVYRDVLNLCNRVLTNMPPTEQLTDHEQSLMRYLGQFRDAAASEVKIQG